MQSEGKDILTSLDQFIRKYYKNMAVRGVICAVAIVSVLFLGIVLLEHFGWLSRVVRGLLFWLGLIAILSVIGWFVVRPLFKMHGLGPRITRQEAARIVGYHFPEIKDRLVNLLQLIDNANEVDDQSGLLLAAIEQKSAQVRPIPLLKAINIGANKKYLKYALPPLVVILLLMIVAPRVVTGPAKRIAHYNTLYQRPTPFVFKIINKDLTVGQGEDYGLQVVTEGVSRPADVWLIMGDRRFRMQGTDTFSFVFHQVMQTIDFAMEGGGVKSSLYRLQVNPNPKILSFRIFLDYPAYTGREDEFLDGIGDVNVPVGSKLQWFFHTQNADSIYLDADSGKVHLCIPVDKRGQAQSARTVMREMYYSLSVGRSGVVSNDTLRYNIVAIPDVMPQIFVEEMVDSANPDRRVFRGRINDDYGFSKLVFVRTASPHATGDQRDSSEAEIALDRGLSTQDFYFSFNMAPLSLKPGDSLAYWFEVSDNDAIFGPKTTKSRQFLMYIPSDDEIDSLLDKGTNLVHESANRQIADMQTLQQEINEVMQRLIEKKEIGWQEKKELEHLAEKQRQLRQMMQQMQQQINENNRLEQRYREQSEHLMEKQRELDRLMNEVLDEKMRETLQEIERLMQEVDKKKLQQALDKIKIDNKELENQLDRNIELMKRLELEKKVEETVQKIDHLSKKQRDLSPKTDSVKGSNADLIKKQKDLDDEFKMLENEIKQIQQQYNELDPTVNFKIPTDLQQHIHSTQQQIQQQLKQGSNKEASKMQQQAADDMERLAEALAESQVEAEQQGLAEDAEMVRQLLKNLVTLSMNQEELSADAASIYIQDPRYQTILLRQSRLKDDFVNVADSLHALARRQIQVASVLDKNIGEVNTSMANSLQGLLDMNQSYYANHRNVQVSRPMQYSMTALNNLALVLAESLDKMQSQMRQNNLRMKSGQCKNPNNSGNGKSGKTGKGLGNASPQTMRQMQQALNKQMEALKKQIEQQNKGNSSSRHELGKSQQLSEDLAKMAAQQEAIRRMMQSYGQELKESSGGDPTLAREIDHIIHQMEQTETELVNKTITRQTLQRQHQIMTRLLEHERAELQREREERRESQEAQELYGQPSLEEMKRYERQSKPMQDQMRTLPATMTPYYRNMVNEFLFQQ